MTNTLTEQWREGTLERGYYYYKTKVGAEVIGYQCFGLKFPYDYNHNTIDSVKEVLGPVPDYMDCKGLIYDSINLTDARKRIDELVSKTEQLKKNLEVSEKAHYKTLEQLRIATKALSDIEDGYSEATGSGQIVRQALKEMEGVK